jgi:hypothetical protein
MVSLHSRTCTCYSCNPGSIQTTAGGFASYSIHISRDLWVQLGKPNCVEDYERKYRDLYGPKCPHCGNPSNTALLNIAIS